MHRMFFLFKFQRVFLPGSNSNSDRGSQCNINILLLHSLCSPRPTVFCVDPSAASAKVPRPTAVLEGTFSCYQPCKCGGGNFHRFRNPLQKYILPNFLVQPFEMSDNTVVIHVRSGDVMRTTGGVKYCELHPAML